MDGPPYGAVHRPGRRGRTHRTGSSDVEVPNEGTATFSAVHVPNQILGDDLEGTTTSLTATNGTTYRYAGAAYNSNWSTKGLEAGTYRVTFENDEGSHTVRISLRCTGDAGPVSEARSAYRAPASSLEGPVFAFFSNRLGCLGSIVVSIIGTLILLGLMQRWFR